MIILSLVFSVMATILMSAWFIVIPLIVIIVILIVKKNK